VICRPASAGEQGCGAVLGCPVCPLQHCIVDPHSGCRRRDGSPVSTCVWQPPGEHRCGQGGPPAELASSGIACRGDGHRLHRRHVQHPASRLPESPPAVSARHGVGRRPASHEVRVGPLAFLPGSAGIRPAPAASLPVSSCGRSFHGLEELAARAASGRWTGVGARVADPLICLCAPAGPAAADEAWAGGGCASPPPQHVRPRRVVRCRLRESGLSGRGWGGGIDAV